MHGANARQEIRGLFLGLLRENNVGALFQPEREGALSESDRAVPQEFADFLEFDAIREQPGRVARAQVFHRQLGESSACNHRPKEPAPHVVRISPADHEAVGLLLLGAGLGVLVLLHRASRRW
jgi:hypothetical protein